MDERTGPIKTDVSNLPDRAPSVRDPASEIRQNIEQTRDQLSGTIGEIQERLSPSHLKEQVKDQVKTQFQDAKHAVRDATIGKVENMRNTIWQAIKENPLPSALAAVGLTWLIMNRRSSSSYSPKGVRQGGYGPSYYGNGNRLESQGDVAAAGKAIHQVQEKAGELKEQAQAKMGDWVDQGKRQARRVESQFGQWMDSNPVALGAVALTLGTAVGLALPRTEKEDQWLGEARDTLVEKAQNLAGEAVDKAKEVATQG